MNISSHNLWICLAILASVATTPTTVQAQNAANDRVGDPIGGGEVKKLDSGLFLGMNASQRDADLMLAAGTVNPVTHKPYDVIFGFGMRGNKRVTMIWELGRVVGDNLRYKPFQHQEQLAGLHLKNAVAHSNGADLLAAALGAGIVRTESLVAFGPPAGFQHEARLLPVSDIKVRVNEGDPVPESLGKGVVLGALQTMGHFDLGIIDRPGSDDPLIGFKVTVPFGDRTEVDVKVFKEESGYLTSDGLFGPHAYELYANNEALDRIHYLERALRTADPGVLTEAKRSELVAELNSLRADFPIAASHFDRTTGQFADFEGGSGSPSSGVRSGLEGGVESHPISVALALQAVTAAAPRTNIALKDLLPTSGPPKTKPVLVTPQQTIRDGNALEALAVDFRRDPLDKNSTIGVVLVTRTSGEVYTHDYHSCARFKGFVMYAPQAVRIPQIELGAQTAPSRWFWRCLVRHPRTQRVEQAYSFSVLVHPSSREFVVDSRWIEPQYASHFAASSKVDDAQVLNFQVWATRGMDAHRLLLDTLSQLAATDDSWRVAYANNRGPVPPTVFIESAWIEDDRVHLSAWNRRSSPRMALLHGTTRSHPTAADIPFEHWQPLQPGRNIFRLPLRNVDNAVVWCQAEDFLDKVYVSVKEQGGSPWQRFGSVDRDNAASDDGPSIQIVWPPTGRSVKLGQDFRDSPYDNRLAIQGRVEGWRPGWTVGVDVVTDKPYPQQPAVVRDGLWGARVHLDGEGEFSQHTIRVTLRDENGRQVSADSVADICPHYSKRVEPKTTTREK